MKKLRLLKLLIGTFVLFLLGSSVQSCKPMQYRCYKAMIDSDTDSTNSGQKLSREERRLLREQMEEDELWGGDDEYNPWEENDEYDRDRW